MSDINLISRREAIQRVTAVLGGIALVGGSSLLTGCREPNTDEPFATEEVAYLDEIAETILPQTSTPGAKAAKTGAFMALMVTDSYSPADRKIFRDGMEQLDQRCRRENGASFMSATAQQRLSLLEKLDREQIRHSQLRENANRKKKGLKEMPLETPGINDPDPRIPQDEYAEAVTIAADTPAHYFRMMKELALLGYFTSEIGCTQAQRYIESPGRFDPCVPYTPGEKAWAPHA
ncbi:MAG: gluconate 2-dehydrogenase subunit 3 family protein [Gemmatimonadaceae bacterium]